MSTKVVSVEKDDCTACSQCADNLPKYFRVDDDGIAESHIDGDSVNKAEIPEEDQKLVENEINECPGECIHWQK